MRIEINIDELVLEGFSYHDHRRIRIAFERELGRKIKEKSLPLAEAGKHSIQKIDGGSFAVPLDGDPRKIGNQVAASVYKGLQRK